MYIRICAWLTGDLAGILETLAATQSGHDSHALGYRSACAAIGHALGIGNNDPTRVTSSVWLYQTIAPILEAMASSQRNRDARAAGFLAALRDFAHAIGASVDIPDPASSISCGARYSRVLYQIGDGR